MHNYLKRGGITTQYLIHLFSVNSYYRLLDCYIYTDGTLVIIDINNTDLVPVTESEIPAEDRLKLQYNLERELGNNANIYKNQCSPSFYNF